MGIPYEVAEQLLMQYMVFVPSMLIAVGVTAYGFHTFGWRYVYLGGSVAAYVWLTT